MASDRWSLLWLVVPLAFFLASTYFVFDRRKRQIAAWDLRLSPEMPSARGIIQAVVGTAVAGFLGFAIYNLVLETDVSQKGLNIGLWFFGTAIGAAFALYVGLRLAEPRPVADSTREN